MQTQSDQPVAALSWACVLGALVLSLVTDAGPAAIVAAAALGLVFWRFPPGRPNARVSPGDLLWTAEGPGPAYEADRLRPVLVRDLELVQGLVLPEGQPLSPDLVATEVALRVMHRGGILDARRLSDRDVVALALLRDAIAAEPARAARLAAAFRDPAAVLDLRDRVRGRPAFRSAPSRVA
ncbi:hypothetical protein [Citreimonas sp.]|uniref:hypothetical protein n=1 Tax=Citreimonas sp. TaxID=3036715 RepID=UPI0040586E07